MKYLDDYIARLQKMSNMIEKRCTGSPCEFASKLGMSRRVLFVEIDNLREMVGKYGVHIVFDRAIRSYIYDQPGSFKLADSFWEKE
ncbi:MAG: hypothetical protein ABR968_00825 [Bacteroidales bacterium]|jgi:hypothetical protein